MTFASTGFGYVLFLEPGDELIRCLIHFARSQEVDAAVLHGTGTVAELELGADAAPAGERRTLVEPLEACSLTGTLTLVDGEPFPSMRGSFARADCSVIGGQVFQAVCRTSLEVAVQLAPAPPADGAEDAAAAGATGGTGTNAPNTTDGTAK